MSNNQDKIPEEFTRWVREWTARGPTGIFHSKEQAFEIGFEDGAYRAYIHLSQQQGPRWVKASERMPEQLDGVIFRNILTKVYQYHILDADATTIYAEGRNDELYLRKDEMEWLEEIAESSPVTSTQDDPGDSLEEGLQLAADAGMSQTAWDKQRAPKVDREKEIAADFVFWVDANAFRHGDIFLYLGEEFTIGQLYDLFLLQSQNNYPQPSTPPQTDK